MTFPTHRVERLAFAPPPNTRSAVAQADVDVHVELLEGVPFVRRQMPAKAVRALECISKVRPTIGQAVVASACRQNPSQRLILPAITPAFDKSFGFLRLDRCPS